MINSLRLCSTLLVQERKEGYTTLKGNNSHRFLRSCKSIVENLDGFYPKSAAINFYSSFIGGVWHHQAIKCTEWVGVIKSAIKWVIVTFWHWNWHNWFKTSLSWKLLNLKHHLHDFRVFYKPYLPKLQKIAIFLS